MNRQFIASKCRPPLSEWWKGGASSDGSEAQFFGASHRSATHTYEADFARGTASIAFIHQPCVASWPYFSGTLSAPAAKVVRAAPCVAEPPTLVAATAPEAAGPTPLVVPQTTGVVRLPTLGVRQTTPVAGKRPREFTKLPAFSRSWTPEGHTIFEDRPNTIRASFHEAH